MYILYIPQKVKNGCWKLQHPENSLSSIGFFKSRKAAMQYQIDCMAKIINR
jgi:hypothetical protein